MPPTSLQAQAIAAFHEGANVVVRAVPGAGKSWTIREFAKATTADRRAVVLAYNNELCADVKARLKEAGTDEHASVFTFHGLASHAIKLSPDDAALLDAVQGAEEGRYDVAKVAADVIIVDEAQDMNPLHKRLLAVALELDPDKVQYAVIGDANQLLYDYGTNPACPAYLRAPREHFASARPWVEVTLDASHRLTPPMAHVVAAVFGKPIESAKVEAGAAPVMLHSCSKWHLGPLLYRLVHGRERETVVLSSTRRGNAPLRQALNVLSNGGVPIHVHGASAGGDPRLKEGKLKVSTWHASKGTEAARCIVLAPARCDANPLYVALTRGYEELHVVLFSQEPNLSLCRALGRLLLGEPGGAPPSPHVRACDPGVAKLCVSALQTLDVVEDETPRPARATLCFDYRPPADRAVAEFASVEVVRAAAEPDPPPPPAVVRAGALHEDVTPVYERAVLAALEFEFTGRVRGVEDVRAPTRLPFEHQDVAVRLGLVSRFVAPFVSEEALLPADLRREMLAAYAREEKDMADWCTIACGQLAWNELHSVMRQALPVAPWLDEDGLNAVYARVRALLPTEGVLFDVRQKKAAGPHGTLCHARVHAASAERCWHFAWGPELGGADVARAAASAALHASGACDLVCMASGEVRQVRAQAPFLDACVE